MYIKQSSLNSAINRTCLDDFVFLPLREIFGEKLLLGTFKFFVKLLLVTYREQVTGIDHEIINFKNERTSHLEIFTNLKGS